MSKPLISIVLPSYNGSRYLEEAVESCLEQTYDNLEVILVDDASTDNTFDICQQLAIKDSRIKLIKHETNRKLPAALNTGFSIARGQFLTWTSDDNCYEPDALKVMIDFLLSHPDVDIVYTGYNIIDEKGTLKDSVPARRLQNIVSENIVGPCFLYRRKVQEVLKSYDVTIFLAEDYEFWLRASVQFEIAPLACCYYRYRSHDSSLSQQHRATIDLAHRAALRRSLPDMKWLSPRVRAIGWLNLSALAWTAKDIKDFRMCVKHAILSSPFISFLVFVKVLFLGRRIVREKPLRIPTWLNDLE